MSDMSVVGRIDGAPLVGTANRRAIPCRATVPSWDVAAVLVVISRRQPENTLDG